jgi:hypothetical protein
MGTHVPYLVEFTPIIMGAALFKSLSNASLPSVTSVSLIKGIPPSMLIKAILGLIEHLPQVECMRISPSHLATQVLQNPSGSLELYPELMEFDVTATDEDCEEAVKLVGEMLKV